MSEVYQDIVDELSITEHIDTGKWFSLPCMKANGYIFCALWLNGDMVFKLKGEAHQQALAIEGAQLFDPLEKNRPMKEWVQVPQDHDDQWLAFAKSALAYIREHPPK